VDTTDGELQAGARGPRDGLLLVSGLAFLASDCPLFSSHTRKALATGGEQIHQTTQADVAENASSMQVKCALEHSVPDIAPTLAPFPERPLAPFPLMFVKKRRRRGDEGSE